VPFEKEINYPYIPDLRSVKKERNNMPHYLPNFQFDLSKGTMQKFNREIAKMTKNNMKRKFKEILTKHRPLLKYVRNNRYEPVGVLLAYKDESGAVRSGWSRVNKSAGDRWCRNSGVCQAYDRAKPDGLKDVPYSFREVAEQFEGRTGRYFKAPPERTFIGLELTKKEMAALYLVLTNISGKYKSSARNFTDDILRSLEDYANFNEWDIPDIAFGSIEFIDGYDAFNKWVETIQKNKREI
jgi:hypothetical protein